jgi:hypothetical protein
MIKQILLIAVFLGASVYAFAGPPVWKSSWTITAETGTLCGGGKRGVYHGVCVNTAVASSSVTVVNSSFTATGSQSFGIKNTNASGCFYYDVLAPKGLFYTKVGLADVTMLYDCY